MSRDPPREQGKKSARELNQIDTRGGGGGLTLLGRGDGERSLRFRLVAATVWSVKPPANCITACVDRVKRRIEGKC